MNMVGIPLSTQVFAREQTAIEKVDVTKLGVEDRAQAALVALERGFARVN